MAPTSETCGTSWTSSWWWELWLPSPWRESLYVAACRWLKSDSLRQTVPCKPGVIIKGLNSVRWLFLTSLASDFDEVSLLLDVRGHRGQAKRKEKGKSRVGFLSRLVWRNVFFFVVSVSHPVRWNSRHFVPLAVNAKDSTVRWYLRRVYTCDPHCVSLFMP